MIYVTKLNGKVFALNPDLIEIMESTPDTLITLTNEKRYIVKESIEELIDRIVEYRQRCISRRISIDEL